ncbi:hypothetical protein F443_05192 [Phytophthora nicotianae P1569]|uniref:Uncharacterized protein n=1 Tax=Phytophthora nicotianae P1569 TaxID=1317065 RepID=V9FKZ2_PHYNI|nr:hypothetical protein F443_05192 [Phytophthora nicotianae P1569]
MNHKSATSMGNALLGSIRAGQDNETYMVVDEDAAKHWLDLQLSTFGCVPMPGVDPHLGARVIHDLSYPCGVSVNDLSDPNNLPPLPFEAVGDLARRIERIKA